MKISAWNRIYSELKNQVVLGVLFCTITEYHNGVIFNEQKIIYNGQNSRVYEIQYLRGWHILRVVLLHHQNCSSKMALISWERQKCLMF